MKADDVMVRDVKYCQESLDRDLIVITQDTELIKRCKRAAERGGFMNGKRIRKSLQVIILFHWHHFTAHVFFMKHPLRNGTGKSTGGVGARGSFKLKQQHNLVLF